MALFAGALRDIAALSRQGVEAIPFKGPVLALQAYGDLGLRVFRDLDFLVRDDAVGTTIVALGGFGYDRQPGLTTAQYDRITGFRARKFLFKRDGEGAVEPHTRLMPGEDGA